MKGFILYPTYRIKDGKADVHLYGTLENGESFVSIHKFRPYFFIKKSQLEKARSLGSFDDESSDLKTFDGEPVTRIILDIPRDVPDLRKSFEDAGIPTYEADIRYSYRFMMDKGILGSLEIEGDYEKGENVSRIYHDAKISHSSYYPKLKVLSFDIESDMDQTQIFCISAYLGDKGYVLMVSDKPVKGCEIFADEAAMLQRFKEIVLEEDPDVLTGWNVIDFDMDMLKRFFAKHRIPFTIARTNDETKLRIQSDFFRDSTADVPGRVVLDGISLLKSSFIRLEDYKLGTAAAEFLGEKKLIGESGKVEEIHRLFKEDKAKLAAYNLKDSKLAYDILDKSGALNLSIERSLLTGMPIDRVRASIASLDSLYLRELRSRKLVASTGIFVEKESPITGGYVMASKPGIYDYVIVCDFKSLYPSIMRTFNIDPVSYVREKPKDKKGLIEAPNGALFRDEDGILPMLLQRLWKRRDEAKKRKDKLATLAIKILMNSFFGVLASPNCRFFSMEMSNAITTFGQHIIKLASKQAGDMGYDVIYGDTDSIFINLHVKDEKEAIKVGNQIQDRINEFFSGHIKNEYKRPNFLELEFEKVYKKFWMPATRGTGQGSKKRYAGLLLKDGKEEMDFVGLEFVRRDWTDLAKKFQLGLLDRVFHDKPLGAYIKGFIKDLKSGKHDGLLVYRKAIRKSVDEYTKTTPPHVKAARKLKKITSNIIEYYMTLNGPEPLEEHKSAIDYEHYIEKQLQPIAEARLQYTGEQFDEFAKKTSQKGLGDFG